MFSTRARPPGGYQAPRPGAANLPLVPVKPAKGFVDAWLAAGCLAVLCAIVVADHLPFAASWLLETTLFTGSFTGMTLYKANRWGWAWTGYVAVVALAELVAHAAGADSSGFAVFWAAGLLIAVGWVCMLRLDRYRQAEPAPVRRVEHHYFIHGVPDGVPVPPVAARAVYGEVVQPEAPGIAAPRRPAGVLGGAGRSAFGKFAAVIGERAGR